MILTAEQQRMLAGDLGGALEYAMKIQTGIGRIFGANRLVSPSRVHVSMAGGCKADYWFVNKMLNLGGKCKISPTVNPSVDTSYINQHLAELPDEWKDIIRATNESYKKIGTQLTFSCTPYLMENVPSFGEILAFSESSVTVYANSVIGARTNRESCQSALCAAITGLVPEYGLLLSENRKAEIVVKVKAKLMTDFDWRLLGWCYPLKYRGPEVPVFVGIDDQPTQEGLINFGAELNVTGAVALFHIEGVTPEAPDLKSIMKKRNPKEYVEITQEDIERTRDKICGAPGKIDFAMFGCPHWTLRQIEDAIKVISGRNFAVDVWILTSAHVRDLAIQNGYAEIINNAGGHIVADTCADEPCWWPYYGKTGISDSPKCKYYNAMRNMNYKLRPLEQAVEAAIAGEVTV